MLSLLILICNEVQLQRCIFSILSAQPKLYFLSWNFVKKNFNVLYKSETIIKVMYLYSVRFMQMSLTFFL